MTGRHVWMLRLLSIALAAWLLVSSLLTSPVASAQDEQVKLSIVPVGVEGGYFDLTMQPGDVRGLSVQISNGGSAAIVARTYPADAYTIVNGGFGARLAGEPISGTTRWIDYTDQTLALEPGETVIRSFSVRVPTDAGPGQYLTSLAIQNAAPLGDNAGTGLGLNQVIRQAFAVAIRVPGPDAPALQIGQASHALVAGTSVISIEVLNPGSVHLMPYGDFTLTDAEGATVARLRLQMATVYSGTGTLVEAPLPQLLEVGAYTVNLVLQDGTYGVRADSGPLPLSIPVLNVPQTAQVAETAADQPADPAAETRVISVSGWELLVAIPAAALLGALIALAVMLGLRRRSAPQIHIAPPIVVMSSASPPHKPAVIRPLIPPSRRVDLQVKPPTSQNDSGP